MALELSHHSRALRRHELHDEVGQVLTGLRLTMESVADLSEGKVKTRLGEAQASAKVVAELKSIWSVGFPSMEDAFGWDEMHDGLPASAMVAFVKGAGEAWATRSRPC